MEVGFWEEQSPAARIAIRDSCDQGPAGDMCPVFLYFLLHENNGISFCGDMKELTQSSVCVCVCVCVCVVVSNSLQPHTLAHQAPLSMEFPRQEYWSGLPFPSPGDLPDPRIEPMSPALQPDALLSELGGKPHEIPE